MTERPSALERVAARNLVRRYLRVKPGENAIVESWTHTLPMASAMVDEIRRAGGGALLAYENDDAWWRTVGRRQTRLLGRLSEPEWAALGAAQIYVMFWGPGDSARVETVAEQRMDETTGWFDRWYRVAQSTGLRGGRMALGFVTDARVRHWRVSRTAWSNGLLKGCLVDPEQLARNGARLARAFSGSRKVRITHPNGTDIELGVGRARPRIFDGRPHPKDPAYGPYDMMTGLPGGRFCLALDSRTAEGTIVATHPSYDLTWYPWQRYLGGVFEFSHGRLTSYSFEHGGSEFSRHYAKASRGKDRTGSLVIGLNPKVKNVPYAEDIERGSVRVSVGSNAYVGGSNPSDLTGWLALAGSVVLVDGTPVVRSGKIL